jgi:NAD+ kinase
MLPFRRRSTPSTCPIPHSKEPMPQFRTVGIVGKQSDAPEVGATVRRLVVHLRSRGCQVLLDRESARLLQRQAEDGMPLTALGVRCELVVAVGGDGTLLHAARAMAAHGVPLLGVNLGRLGFLADISPTDMEQALDAILEGAYETDARAMLTTRVVGESPCERAFTALNDVAIHKWGTARMIHFETYIDGVFVNAQRSDGLIVATPTGSTAYALSGGGPLVHPSLDAILLVPICPHDLSNRPLVVPGGSRIEVRVDGHDPGHAQVTCDGQTQIPLPRHACVQIDRHPDRACLLHPLGHDHYQILRAKLGWGGRQQAD